ncbi:MAG: hypothetical protein R2724_17485 [Bryobacterales bacterium]
MRASILLLAALALPLSAGPKDAGFTDSFHSPTMANRRLERGDWRVANGVARVSQDDALYKKYKNHGPIVFYDLPMRDVRVRFEVKLEDAKRFVFTFNGNGGHVFRLLQNPDNSALLAFEDKDGKHSPLRLDTSAPHVDNGEWIPYSIEIQGETAKVSIGDAYRKSVRHPSLAAPKTNLSLSFHYGELEVRNLHVEPL